MKRRGQITYELSEEEMKRIVIAVRDIKYFFDHDEDRDDAERGIYDLEDIFGDIE